MMVEINRKAKKIFRRLQRKGIRQLTIQSGDELYVFSGNPEKRKSRLVFLLILLAASLTLVLLVERPFFMKRPTPVSEPPDLPRDRSGLTPLHLGAIAGDREKIRLWLDRHADVNTLDEYGWTPLHWAVFIGNSSICRLLIENGARVDLGSTLSWYRYPTGITPLEMARSNQKPDIVALLEYKGEG